MRALIPSAVPAEIGQYGSRIGQLALPINGRNSRAFSRFLPDNVSHLTAQGCLRLLLQSLRVKEYSDYVLLFFFSPPHLLHCPPAPFPDKYLIIVAVVCVYTVCFM